MLLCCAEAASIGISNFAMLAAPMAGATALASIAVCAHRNVYPRILTAGATLLIPVPYLIFVAIASKSGADIVGALESAPTVWITVFGAKQQYLVALLLLAGPAFAKNLQTRTWLAIPPLVLLGIYLNPFLSDFISHYITTPPVYWRVIWCFPILVYIAWSLCLALERASQLPRLRNPAAWVAIASLALVVYSASLNVLRKGNGVEWRFAQYKVPTTELAVATRASDLAIPDTRILAPESISTILPMFEHHPRLIGVRDMYLQMLAPAIGSSDYHARMLLLGLVSGESLEAVNHKEISTALDQLKVSVAVVGGRASNLSPVAPILLENGFAPVETMHSFTIWRRDKTMP
jgi:hypothetical protein